MSCILKEIITQQHKECSVGISPGASIVYLPDCGAPYPSILYFLTGRFPKIPEQIWKERIAAGKILTENGIPISSTTQYVPDSRLFYFREVERELDIPFQEKILFNNDDLMVVCKPHFLPVTPSGPYVLSTLINRLKKSTGNPFLSPINRIDRETAGLVLISKNSKTRGTYQQLFMTGEIRKTYEAVSACRKRPEKSQWMVENRMEKGEPWFRMKTVPGIVNARTRIQLIATSATTARFLLSPLTGKKHQLRLHLSDLGFPILNDRCYPQLLPEQADNFCSPLQLLARKIQFRDPITGQEMVFESERVLSQA